MTDEPSATNGDAHPLQRAHRFFQKAAPAIRDAQDRLEQAGGIDGVRETVARKADELVQRVDEVVANATAIEGEVVEHADAAAGGSAGNVAASVAPRPARATRRRWHYLEVAVIAAAATWGALALQRRLRD